MKFLYLIPFLLPQVTFACVGRDPDPIGVGFAVVTALVIFAAGVSLATSMLLLLVMRLLPRNKGLTMSAIFAKAKRTLWISTGIVFALLVIGFAVLIGVTQYQTNIPSGGSYFSNPLC